MIIPCMNSGGSVERIANITDKVNVAASSFNDMHKNLDLLLKQLTEVRDLLAEMNNNTCEISIKVNIEQEKN